MKRGETFTGATARRQPARGSISFGGSGNITISWEREEAILIATEMLRVATSPDLNRDKPIRLAGYQPKRNKNGITSFSVLGARVCSD